MISVNCPKSQLVIDNLSGKEIDGVTFEFVRSQGLSSLFRTSDDAKAKVIVKQHIGSLPEMKYKVLTIQILDENGRLI